MRIRSVVVAFGVVAACGGVDDSAGLGEPLRVEGATFRPGKWPNAASVVTPTVTAAEQTSAIVKPDQAGKSVDGRVSPNAVAIAMAIADAGTGYWVMPVGGPDPQNGGELDWTATLDFGPSIAPGKHTLQFVAIDAAGHAGPTRTLGICADTATPDNQAACNPAAALPAAVVSLTWDTNVDLDLIISAPDGSFIDAKSPGGVGILDRDSNANCAIDAINREDAVFQKAPTPGSYLVFVNLFASCGNAPVHFEVTTTADGVVTSTKGGTLLDVQANNGTGIGTYVTELVFQ